MAGGPSPEGADVDDERVVPPFVRYGVYTVAIFLAAVGTLVWATAVPVDEASLFAFTLGFLVFVVVYFGAMWAGWLYF